MTTFKRREFLGLGALLLASGPPLFAQSSKTPGLFISAASDADDRHWVLGFHAQDGEVRQAFKQALPERAHHVAINEQRGFYAVVARRPGTWLQLGALDTGTLHAEIHTPTDRHFFGHGVFARDGSLFYTTDSDFDDMTGDSGRIGIWRVEGEGASANLVRIGEHPSYGVGPHELLLHPDGDTLVIANGGIRTHPSHDRDNLNVDTMRPSLAYVDRNTGALLEQHYMPAEFHQSGIRHMDVNADGLVALVMQFEGEPFMEVPLIGTHRRGEEPRLIVAPPGLQPQMQQYVGSVRFDLDGRYFAASCPRGNLISFWDAEAGTLLGTTRARDGCGVCATSGGFLFSTGMGRIAHIELASSTVTDMNAPEELQKLFWDNHMSVTG